MSRLESVEKQRREIDVLRRETARAQSDAKNAKDRAGKSHILLFAYANLLAALGNGIVALSMGARWGNVEYQLRWMLGLLLRYTGNSDTRRLFELIVDDFPKLTIQL